MKKKAIVAGASGLVGSYVVRELLKRDEYEEVKVLVRKPLNLGDPALKQVMYDYEQPDPDEVKADHVYCCLGTTMKKAGSKEAFRKVDYEYPLQLAKAASENGAEKFALISAMGANTKSFFFYNRVKGQVEETLREFPFKTTSIFRPSMLLGPRGEFRLGEEIGKILMKALRFFLPANMKPIHAEKVARAMVKRMTGEEQGVVIVKSGEMQRGN